MFIKTTTVDSDFFGNVNFDSAYLAGLLAADGSVIKKLFL